MAFTLAAANFAAQQGEHVTLTTTEFNITDGVAADYFILSTPPSVGVLLRDGIEIAEDGTFTVADVTAGLITYSNQGDDATNDTIGLRARDTTAESTVSEDTSTVTVTANGGWATVVQPAGFPLMIPLVSQRERDCETYIADWKTRNVGLSDVLELTTAELIDLTGLFVAEQRTDANMHGFNPNEMRYIQDAADTLYADLQDAAYDELVNVISANREFAYLDRSTLTDAESVQMRDLFNHLSGPSQRNVPKKIVEPWWAILSKAWAKITA